MRKYIFWSENPRSGKIQVISPDQKPFKTTLITLSFWKKNLKSIVILLRFIRELFLFLQTKHSMNNWFSSRHANTNSNIIYKRSLWDLHSIPKFTKSKKYIDQEPPYLMRQICVLQWEEIKTKNSGATQIHY